MMQLPPDDAVVMSSVALIRAKKLRYYADANFKRRVLPPPRWRTGSTPTRRHRAPTTGAAWRFRPCLPRRPWHPPMAGRHRRRWPAPAAGAIRGCRVPP
ncbi:hypothetical protein M8494_23070 [Serratia ureilytica]